MKKTLYLHIGMAKTGTSAIQKMLSQNREYLKKLNLDYLEFPFERNAIHETLNELNAARTIATIKKVFSTNLKSELK